MINKLILVTGLFLGFYILSEVRINTNNKTVATPINGIDAISKNFKTPVSITGTVVNTIIKDTGAVNLNFETDDNRNIQIVINPTVNTKIPKLGDRLEITAHQIDKGLFSISKRDDIKYLPSSIVVETPPEIIYNFKEIKPMERIVTFGNINIGPYTEKGFSAFLYGSHGSLIRLFIPKNEIKKTNIKDWEEVSVVGHLNHNHIFVVEELRPLSKD